MAKVPLTDTRKRLNKDDILSVLLSQRYQDKLFSDIVGLKPGAKETTGTCPFCGKEKHFSYNLAKPVWKCFSCNESGDWFTYLEKRRGMDFVTALKELAREAGIEVSEADQEQYKARQRRSSLLEEACRYFKETLLTTEGEAVYAYLQERGYSDQDIQAMELGAFVNRGRLSIRLKEKGFSVEDNQDVEGLLYGKRADGSTYTTDYLKDYPLAIPIQGSSCQTIGIAFRRIDDNKDKYRYAGGAGVQKAGLTGLSRAINSPRKILVEGVLDAHYVNYKAEEAGFNEPIIALGTNRISDEQIKALEDTKTEEVILALDSDTKGQEGTAEIIHMLRLQCPKIKLYVAQIEDYAETPDSKVDPDSLVREQGIQAFIDACHNADSWSRWYSLWTVVTMDKKESLSSDRGREQLLQKLSMTYADIQDRQEKLFFLEPLKDMSIGIEDLKTASESYSRTLTEEHIKAKVKQLQEDIGRTSLEDQDSGHFTTKYIETVLRSGLSDIQAQQSKAPEPYLLSDLRADILTTEEGLLTGFEALDKRLKIPQGALTIIAGRPGQGKTTLQLNLLVNMLKNKLYNDKEFYFFSYEESRKALAVKLIMILSGIIVDPTKADSNYEEYFRYLRGGDRRKESGIEEALDTYETLTSSGRLWLLDSRLNAEELCQQISYLNKREATGAVFVDYIQKIPVSKSVSASQRYLELKDVSGRLLDTAVNLNIPILLGAQLGRPEKGASNKTIKLENLRESGDIEQDANLVIGAHCKAIEAMQDAEKGVEDGVEDDKKREVTLDLYVLKNRAGISGIKTTVTFDRPILTIKDTQKDKTGRL